MEVSLGLACYPFHSSIPCLSPISLRRKVGDTQHVARACRAYFGNSAEIQLLLRGVHLPLRGCEVLSVAAGPKFHENAKRDASTGGHSGEDAAEEVGEAE